MAKCPKCGARKAPAGELALFSEYTERWTCGSMVNKKKKFKQDALCLIRELKVKLAEAIKDKEYAYETVKAMTESRNEIIKENNELIKKLNEIGWYR